MKTFNEFVEIASNPSYNYGMFEYIIEAEDGVCVDGFVVSIDNIRDINRFIDETNDYNVSKIREMINNNIHNINRVLNIIENYDKVKSQQYTQ